MSLIDGFLSICSAISGTTVTEIPGIARQPISFRSAYFGGSRNSTPYSFGSAIAGPYAGYAIYDAPGAGAGNLLIVLPFAAPQPAPMSGPSDRGDAGDLYLSFTGLAGYENSDAFSGTFTAGATIGTWWRERDIISRASVVAGNSGYATVANMTPMLAGVGLTITRGILRAT